MHNHSSKPAAVCPWICSHLASCLWISGDSSYKVQLFPHTPHTVGNGPRAVPPMTAGIGKIPSPGGRVAPKGSGEECGRKAESSYNITDLFRGVVVGTRSRSSRSRSSNVTARIPLQSWKSLWAISMTASPRGKRFSAPAGRRAILESPLHFYEHVPYKK